MLISMLWYECTTTKGRVSIVVACCMQLFRGSVIVCHACWCFYWCCCCWSSVCAWLFIMQVFGVVDAATTAGACADVKPNVLTSCLKFFLENFGSSYLWGLFFSVAYVSDVWTWIVHIVLDIPLMGSPDYVWQGEYRTCVLCNCMIIFDIFYVCNLYNVHKFSM